MVTKVQVNINQYYLYIFGEYNNHSLCTETSSKRYLELYFCWMGWYSSILGSKRITIFKKNIWSSHLRPIDRHWPDWKHSFGLLITIMRNSIYDLIIEYNDFRPFHPENNSTFHIYVVNIHTYIQIMGTLL